MFDLTKCIQSCQDQLKEANTLFVCLLLIVHEKDIVGKYELASYNGTLMEPYGSQHPGKRSTKF